MTLQTGRLEIMRTLDTYRLIMIEQPFAPRSFAANSLARYATKE